MVVSLRGLHSGQPARRCFGHRRLWCATGVASARVPNRTPAVESRYVMCAPTLPADRPGQNGLRASTRRRHVSVMTQTRLSGKSVLSFNLSGGGRPLA
jgi:hypothetical protein